MLTRNLLFSFLLLLGSVLSSGCTPSACPGKAGCTCDDKTPCESGYRCENSVCKTTTDESHEEPLPLEETTTEQDAGPTERCIAGQAGCRCLESATCLAGLRCESDLCRVCPEGTAGCACKADKSCNNGMTCENDRCIGCIGKHGCSCFGNGNCEAGNRCHLAKDGANSCVACTSGEIDCNCAKDSDCGGALLCVNKRCMDASQANRIPQSPTCYSDCEGDIKAKDGTLKVCHPEYKLVEGCPAGQTCHEGSCRSSEQIKQDDPKAYPYCQTDAHCPAWQACVQGRCYSTCRATSECPNGFKCFSYVCRRECNLRTNLCDNSSLCSTKGKDDGVCLPKPNPHNPSPPQTTSAGTFALPFHTMEFNNATTTGEFRIHNKGEFPADFVISRLRDDIGSTKPLAWLKFDVCKTYSSDGTSCTAFEGRPTAQEPIRLPNVPAGKTVILRVSDANGKPPSHTSYTGALQIQSPRYGTQEAGIEYQERLDGHWKGTMVAFGNFDDTNIDKFPASASLDLRTLKNAFLRLWLNFKRREISREQFFAVLRSLREGTWQVKQVAETCRTLYSSQASEDVLCYPYASEKGYEILSYSQREAPPPSGASELPFAIDLKQKTDTTLEGRIDSTHTLHYAGMPQITLQLAEALGTKTLVPLSAMSATIDLGGRYAIGKDQNCDDSTRFAKVTQPWLVPGFTLLSEPRSGSLFRDRFACHAKTLPLVVPPTATAEQKQAIEAANQSLSAANPIPNGWTLRRKLELVDGALIEGNYLFLLYKERFLSFFHDNSGNANALNGDFVNYGYMLLQRVPAERKDTEIIGNPAPKETACTGTSGCPSGEVCIQSTCRPPSRLQQVTCSPQIVKAATGWAITRTSDLYARDSAALGDLASALFGKQSASIANNTNLHITRSEPNGLPTYTYLRSGIPRFIHYYCEDTQQFNGGPTDHPRACPPDSKVVFFEDTLTESELRAHACQSNQSCLPVFTQLTRKSTYRGNVPFRCVSKEAVLCDANRNDLREGKIFFQVSTQSTSFVSSLTPFQNALFEAFRYRLKFQDRTGKNLGFAPEMCNAVASSQTPYCYDPVVLEEIEQRINCLETLFTDNTLHTKLPSAMQSEIKDFLTKAFSYSNENNNGVIVTRPGFETLNAELKVMLGDEAFTRSFASRYDLANTNLVSFQGSLLEPNGPDLSGALGYEMYNLYLSVQYYQMVLDRFFSQANTLYASFASPSRAFLGAGAVTSSMQKLLLASTRKARSWSEIAKRYHALNRADLAKHIVERAYSATFLEMTILTRLLRQMILVLDAREEPQIRTEIEKVTRTYKAALLDMEETYKKLSLSVNHFGLPAGYIPFPALDAFSASTQSTNAFSITLRFAKEKLFTAQSKEEAAIQTKRSFETSAASFQSELVQIEQNYENQLTELCGSIQITDSTGQTRLYPAIPKYTHLSEDGRLLGDLCGLLPGGQIYNALIEVEKARVNIMSFQRTVTDLLERIKLEKERVQKFCDQKFELADITWEYNRKTNSLQLEIEATQRHLQRTIRIAQVLGQAASMAKCETIAGEISGTECRPEGSSLKERVLFALPRILPFVMGGATEGLLAGLESIIIEKRKEILELQAQLRKTQLQFECKSCDVKDKTCNEEGAAQLESKNQIQEHTAALVNINYEILKAEYDLQSTLSTVKRFQQQARRLITQLEENTQLAINVQAAQNDPNTRIYKNDAILTAERTFEDAMREAYRATLVYEYYTGTSYARKGDLYLIRMISYGDKNLETYLSQLEQSFRDFEEEAGKPDIRVLVLSVRDDLLRIPRVNDDKTPRDLNDRVAAFQTILADPNRLNEEGYTTIPFEVTVAKPQSLVSPTTYNHKILYIEAEIHSTSKGDDVARLYLRQKGTSVVRLKASDDEQYYTLPQTTAVINPFFNGAKVFSPDIYRNFRLRDRPLGNTRWELLFNQVSEKANQDIDLKSISDIVLYIYYTDFTKEN